MIAIMADALNNTHIVYTDYQTSITPIIADL